MSTSPKPATSPPTSTGYPFRIPAEESVLDRINAFENDPILRKLWPKGYPLICDEEAEMGESTLHTRTCDILVYGLEFHFAGRTEFRVFRNLNFYYSEESPTLFVAPDAMVVQSSRPLPAHLNSYQRPGRSRPTVDG